MMREQLPSPTSEQATGPIMDPNKATGSASDLELANVELPSPATGGEQGQVLSKEGNDDSPVPLECLLIDLFLMVIQ